MENYKKLTCVMQYLRGAQDLMLTIEPDNHPTGGYTAHMLCTQMCGVTVTAI